MDIKYMDIAFKEAYKAFKLGEVPVGCVIVKDDKIISKAYNTKEKSNCCLNHAELLAIKKASRIINNWRLDGCDIYITLDPCPMCASAIKQARINNVYSALYNKDLSYRSIIRQIFECDSTNPSVNYISNVDQERAQILLNDFFKEHR